MNVAILMPLIGGLWYSPDCHDYQQALIVSHIHNQSLFQTYNNIKREMGVKQGYKKLKIKIYDFYVEEYIEQVLTSLDVSQT